MSARRSAAPVATPALVAIPALAGLLALAPLACGPRGIDTGHPDVVFIVVDTLRADHLGCYGYARPTSPGIDALAGRGTTFDAAWAAAPWTLPSVMSMMTSRYPSSHRVENDGLRLAGDVPTLAAALREAGYVTGGFVSHIYVSAPFGFDRGFETFEDFGISRPGYRLEARMEPTADRVTDAAVAWRAKQRDRPVFLFVHYFDPHWPYEPPESARALFPTGYAGPLDAGYDSISKFQDPLVPIPDDYRQFLIDRYDGEIRFTDSQIGRLIDGLARARGGARPWVVLTGDHGEEFKDHGSMGHGRQLYEEVVRVPLVIAAPPTGEGAVPGAAPAAARVSVPVSGVDLAPTILAIAGVPAPRGMQGRSLLPLLPGARTSGAAPETAGGVDAGMPASGAAATGGATAAPPVDRPLLSETLRLNAYRRAVRIASLKLIDLMGQNRTELYDLAADPGERRDLSGDRPEDRRRLMQALFSEADLLSGGWNLRWSGGGRPHRFEGRITTSGIFRSLVPLFHEQGRYLLQKGDTLVLSDAAQAGESGLTFTTLPYEAKVTFELTIDGRALPQAVILGGLAARPQSLPFSLEGAPQSEAAFERPPDAALRPPCYRLWRTRPAGRDEPVTLDDETRERLRSLGYVN